MVKLSQIALIVGAGLFVSAEAGYTNSDFETKCEKLQQRKLNLDNKLVRVEKKNKQMKQADKDKHCCLKDEMTCEQKETYAYYEGAISALEGAVLDAVDSSPDSFTYTNFWGLEALVNAASTSLYDYQDALERIQSELGDNCPCGKAQKAYMELEAQELALIENMLTDLTNGDGVSAKTVAAQYVTLTESPEASAIDDDYKTTCQIGYI